MHANEHHLAPLIFPSFEMRIVHDGATAKIFDEVRKSYVVLTPEEWVRQHCLHWLVSLGYPLGRCSVERMLQSTNQRYDLLWYDAQVHPYLLVECKSTDNTINSAALRQTALYNQVLQAPYMLLTNGRVAYCVQWNDGVYTQLDDIPTYPRI